MKPNIDIKAKLAELTVEEYLSLNQQVKVKRYEYGIKGIAKIFGCSRNKATKIKSSGDIAGALYQNGNIIVIDVERALELFAEAGKK